MTSISPDHRHIFAANEPESRGTSPNTCSQICYCDLRLALIMDMMANMSGGMMIWMGLVWLLVIVFLVLGIAAMIKYLRSPGTPDSKSDLGRSP